MGLFDPNINLQPAGLFSDPKQLGLLSLGLRLMSTPGSFGQAAGTAGLGAINDMQQAEEANSQREARGVRTAHDTLSLKRAREQMDEEQRTRDYLRGAYTPVAPIDANQASGVAGPRPEALSSVGQVRGFNFADSVRAGVPIMTALQLEQQFKPKPDDFKVVGDSLVRIGGNRVEEAYRAPPKPEALPSDVRTFQYAQQNPAFDQWNRANKQSGASNISVNTGQKGFDNVLKLRGDFRSEPVYKAHQEMQAAYAQIQQSLKQASPAGDLAGATKIMKLLDPGSVVRESELGMAMAASGLMDRVQNYASMIVSGTKLTPTQRKDFQTLADALYRESLNQYNAKRGEYEGIASRNGLNVMDVLGPGGEMPKPTVIKFGDLPGGQ